MINVFVVGNTVNQKIFVPKNFRKIIFCVEKFVGQSGYENILIRKFFNDEKERAIWDVCAACNRASFTMKELERVCCIRSHDKY